jgi:hypothetical protein
MARRNCPESINADFHGVLILHTTSSELPGFLGIGALPRELFLVEAPPWASPVIFASRWGASRPDPVSACFSAAATAPRPFLHRGLALVPLSSGEGFTTQMTHSPEGRYGRHIRSPFLPPTRE